MFVLVSPDGIDLEEADDCTRLHLVGRDVGPEEVAGALIGIGTFDGDNAWVEPSALRALAAGRVASDWDDRFEGMLTYAVGKGRVAPETGRLQLHVEWELTS